ncbi:Cysteine proteinase inhibitor 12 [Nymphaea thermarum]|nr:Cysteine proteinase inhibitor 12 [Nymphaea thermarum]
MRKAIGSSLLFLLVVAQLVVAMAMTGAPKDIPSENSLEISDLGRFAVEEHNKKENALLQFDKVVKAKEQVVAGTLYHLTIEAADGGQKHLYEAKVWVKPWMNFKELQEFKPVTDSAFTSSDLGVKQGWRMVPAHDPIVKEAADHAVKTIQQRSNSLAPYELLEILHVKAEIIEELAKLDMLLKMKRGNKEENFRVEVHKNVEGSYFLNHMQQEHP